VIEKAREALERALAGKDVTIQTESPIVNDGKTRSAEWSTGSLREDGELYVVATGVDITERRSAEEELAKHQGRLEELVRERSSELAVSERRLLDAERLASVGTLAAGVAHQINNPIGTVLVSSEYALLCEGESDERETWRSSLLTSVEQAKRCGDIVRSILRFSAGERADKWPADLGDILRRVFRLTEVYAKERSAILNLDVEEEEELIVLLSPIEIEQVFVNLIHNAIESRDDGVRVDVSARRGEKTVSVTVADDGHGIDPDRLKYVFDPFHTTRTQRGGTGMGLSVACGIVIDHAGRMHIPSEGKREGTEVIVELPLYVKTESS
jgi:two-component system NtrC family sensor kinase